MQGTSLTPYNGNDWFSHIKDINKMIMEKMRDSIDFKNTDIADIIPQVIAPYCTGNDFFRIIRHYRRHICR